MHYSWFVIFIVFTWLLAANIFPESWSWGSRVAIALVTSLLFFASVVAHELSHSVVALRFGIPVKSITLFLFGGVAQIARDASRPRVEILIAVAGPALSFLLGAILLGLAVAFDLFNDHLSEPARYLGGINIWLALFNLIPGFPMDGGRIFRAIAWAVTGNFRRATKWAATLGRSIAWLFILGGIAGFLLSQNPSWFLLSLLGWFLETAASTTYSQTLLRESLQGYTARDLMSQSYVTISPQTNISDLVNSYVLQGSWRYFLVAVGSELLGMLTLHEIRRLPRNRWLSANAGQVMVPKERMRLVSSREEAISVLEAMDEQRLGQLPVVEEGEVIGVVSRDQLTRFVRTRAELGA